MRILSFVALGSLLLYTSCSNSANKTIAAIVSHAPEEEAIKKAVADAYRAICFNQGQVLNFNDIKNCFIPQATLMNFRSDSLQTLTIDQFVDFYRSFVDANKITSFYEEEINGSTDQFGRVAQRISVYKTFINTRDSAIERGVNSFQLVKTQGGWKVSSIIWDIESPALKIPGYYLNADSTE